MTRRRFLAALAATAGGAILAACGDGASVTPTPRATAGTTAVPAATPTTATGSAAAAPSVVLGTTITWFSYRDTTGYTPKSVEAFNAQSSRIKINYQEQGATTDDLRDKFVLVANAKDATIDMISTDVSYLPGYAASGWLLPLDEALPQTERAMFFKGTLDGVTYKGKLYSIPWFNNGPGLFYRKDLLDAAGLKAPATYDELVATSKRLQTPDVSGFVFQGSQNEGGIISWMELLWGHGGDILDEKLNVVVDQGSAATEALQRLVDFVYKDKISIEALLSLKTTTEVTSVFSEGHALFLRQWMSQTSFLDGDQSKVRGKWDVAPLPAKDATKPGPGCLGTWNLGVSAYSKKQSEAIEAVRWLTGFAAQKQRQLGNGNLPTRSAVLDDPEIKAKYPYVEKVKASFENLKPRPVSPFYSQMSVDAVQPNFGAAMARSKTPEQAIRDMAEKLRQIVKG